MKETVQVDFITTVMTTGIFIYCLSQKSCYAGYSAHKVLVFCTDKARATPTANYSPEGEGPLKDFGFPSAPKAKPSTIILLNAQRRNCLIHRIL